MTRLTLLLILCISYNLSGQNKKPNVVLILTDDLGIGDLGCQGNPWLKTPEIDAFYKNAVRLTNFHVSPLCTPTRAAIITGQYPINNGAWATYKGRDALSPNTKTLAHLFKENSYKTALFGKWHLGDNYPSRPTDLGFDNAIHHLAGGIGELSDYWGNSYFDDTYYVNNEPKQFEGYCTDIWFNETKKFIDKNKDNPFFVYLPTNAPHDPLIVAEKYAEPYKKFEGKEIIDANLYGMIANIDENFGRLYHFLENKNLLDNTILIFMSDNGTRFGYSRDGVLGYNKGFEGIKGDKLDGGHRVPFFIRWPNGKIDGGIDINILAEHVDLLPTLASLCNLDVSNIDDLDGSDFSSIFQNKEFYLKEKIGFIHNNQDWRPPSDVAKSCIMMNEWRLIDGHKLYNVEKDPKQQTNITENHPEIAAKLFKENASFISKAKQNPEYYELPVTVIGNKSQKEIKLTIQHAIGEDNGIWKCEQVATGMKNKNNTHAISVERTGGYKISCRRWPKECPGPILSTPIKNPKKLFTYKAISPEKVRISIANQIFEKPILKDDTAVVFKVFLEKGKTLLVNDFIEGSKTYGVYYTYITFLDDNK